MLPGMAIARPHRQAGAAAAWLPGPLHDVLAGGAGAEGGGTGGSVSGCRATHLLLAPCSHELFGMDPDGLQDWVFFGFFS